MVHDRNEIKVNFTQRKMQQTNADTWKTRAYLTLSLYYHTLWLYSSFFVSKTLQATSVLIITFSASVGSASEVTEDPLLQVTLYLKD